MIVPLQMAIAETFFNAGQDLLEQEGLSKSQREAALEYMHIAKGTYQLALAENPPYLARRRKLRAEIQQRIDAAREVLVGAILPDLD
ncbi:hypothetical protein GTO10_01525 [Candidatus Saccharibacteria bacterium]|nr:hypothetical protein [Candidatus Saccharibacteria bacterium]